MKIYDTVNKNEVELNEQGLIDIINAGRQVDFILATPETDEDGYLTWDTEHWSTIDGKRFIRCYSYKGRVLRDSTTHNIYDLKNDFKPAKAEKIQLS